MNRKHRVLHNTFDSQTRDSHKKAVSFLTDSMDKMFNVPLLSIIYNLFLPYFTAYIDLNDAVSLLEGTYKGKTNMFETLIDGLTDKLKVWEGKIRNVFPEDSPMEIEIFPNKRNPFYKGTYEQRRGALRTLRNKIASLLPDYPALATVYDEIAAYTALCEAARSTQQGKEGDLGTLRTQREAQRVTTMDAYFGIVYGGLLQQFFTELLRIADYMDLGYLYGSADRPDVIKTGNVGANNKLYINTAGIFLNSATNITFENPMNLAGSTIIAQFQNDPTAAFDSNRNSILFQSQQPGVATKASEAGFSRTGGFIFLVLYANNEQSAFKITFEQ